MRSIDWDFVEDVTPWTLNFFFIVLVGFYVPRFFLHRMSAAKPVVVFLLSVVTFVIISVVDAVFYEAMHPSQFGTLGEMLIGAFVLLLSFIDELTKKKQ